MSAKVLTNARERQLYDLQIDPRTGRFVRQAVDPSIRAPPFAQRYCPSSRSTQPHGIAYNRSVWMNTRSTREMHGTAICVAAIPSGPLVNGRFLRAYTANVCIL